mgnify:CR=1 FL=1
MSAALQPLQRPQLEVAAAHARLRAFRRVEMQRRRAAQQRAGCKGFVRHRGQKINGGVAAFGDTSRHQKN